MGERNKILSENFKLLYISAIVSVIGTIAGIIPVIGILGSAAVIIAGVIAIVAYVRLSPLHQDYTYALIAMVVGTIACLFDNSMLSIVSTVASLCQLYFLIRATNGFLREIGRMDMADKGDDLWKQTLRISVGIIVLSLVVVIVGSIGSWSFGFGMALALAFMLLLAALSIALFCLRLSYFKGVSEAFGAAL